MNSWYSYVVGLWPIVTTYSLTFVLAAGIAVVGYFVPFLKRKAILAGVALAAMTFAYGVGVNHGSDRVQAQWDNEKRAINETVDEAVDGADAGRFDPDSVRNDPFKLD